MKLHENKDVFVELIGAAAETVSLPEVYVEKDYWVSSVLKKLSASDFADKVVFKGGTSLSKAYKIIDRFSEDVDLAFISDGYSGNQVKKYLGEVEKEISNGLEYLKGDEKESKGSSYRKTVYKYPRATNEGDFGQASPQLLLEINSFTTPEPFKQIKLNSIVAEFLLEHGRSDLLEEFKLDGFYVNVLSVERTLVEKILAVVKDSYGENAVETLRNRIRHMYDICMILRIDEYRKFIQGMEFKGFYEKCIADEEGGFLESNSYKKPLAEAPIFDQNQNWKDKLLSTYNGVFKDLVFGEFPDFGEVLAALEFIKINLKSSAV